MRGHQIILPENLDTEDIGLAHDRHMGAVVPAKQTCWFPNMLEQVCHHVETCIP